MQKSLTTNDTAESLRHSPWANWHRNPVSAQNRKLTRSMDKLQAEARKSGLTAANRIPASDLRSLSSVPWRPDSCPSSRYQQPVSRHRCLYGFKESTAPTRRLRR
jgi:hypothetical protein